MNAEYQFSKMAREYNTAIQQIIEIRDYDTRIAALKHLYKTIEPHWSQLETEERRLKEEALGGLFMNLNISGATPQYINQGGKRPS